MRDAYDVIIRPMVTEKSSRQMGEENVYTFLVDEGANDVDRSDELVLLFERRVGPQDDVAPRHDERMAGRDRESVPESDSQRRLANDARRLDAAERAISDVVGARRLHAAGPAGTGYLRRPQRWCYWSVARPG